MDGQQPSEIQAKEKIKSLMAQEGVKPQELVNMGEMAKKSLYDPALFQLFKRQMIENNIASEEDLTGQNALRFMAVVATVGKMASQMLASGELRG